MKKKERRYSILFLMALCVCLSCFFQAGRVRASEEGAEEGVEETEVETETETEFPESYFLPVESNETPGWPKGPQVEAEAAVVMDANTGAFLYSKNMEAKEYPASITKIMTALVAIENGNLDKKLKCSEHAVYSIEEGSSHCGLQPGEKITLRQALYALMLESANDAANSIAEKVGGSIEEFVQMMNEKAQELGCVNTHFTNAHGLQDEDHYTCAYDMALITKAAFENETLAEIAGTVEYSIPKTNKVKEERYFINHHKMMQGGEYQYEGCVGGKNGYTSDALNTLVTVANRDGRELICVVLRTNGAVKTYEETSSLLDYGYNKFALKTMEESGAELTVADLMDMKLCGRAALLESQTAREPVMEYMESAQVSLPKKGKKRNVKAVYTTDGTFQYTYEGWSVGSVPVRFSSLEVQQLVETTSQAVKETVAREDLEQTESAQQEPGERGFSPAVLVEHVQRFWSGTMEWIYSHDVAAAIVVLILIIALLPVLVVAYVRNRRSQMIRKERRREREERVKRQEEIDSKSVQELEAEIRAELEKEQIKRQREEERRREAQREEEAMTEAEQIIEDYQRTHGGQQEPEDHQPKGEEAQ